MLYPVQFQKHHNRPSKWDSLHFNHSEADEDGMTSRSYFGSIAIGYPNNLVEIFKNIVIIYKKFILISEFYTQSTKNKIDIMFVLMVINSTEKNSLNINRRITLNILE